MALSDAEGIKYYGLILFQGVARTILTCVFHGIYCLAFSASIHIYLSKKNTSRVQRVKILLLPGTFLGIALYLIGTIIHYGKEKQLI
ncbi:hypothetical protein BDP27DRAFT_153511 [Rhodocollybia butyracea]|uniref:Uncharacterized protein n=1 Tax=Rhodocollybia butyracea TaxID=206335 RepID=A0A9P5U366_9AGAR|nr:hypothetical protein BDP27DRAFT_153511 [Rhodocollybia butyracea]